jgi:hypothetical protein
MDTLEVIDLLLCAPALYSTADVFGCGSAALWLIFSFFICANLRPMCSSYQEDTPEK